MEMHESMNEVLNDLVKINNDRISGYEKAMEEVNDLDIDLKAIFDKMMDQSRSNKEEISAEIVKNGGVVEDETSSSGKIYRAWMDIKATIMENDRHSILASCEFGEDATQRAYSAALASGSLLDPETYKLVEDEQNALKKSHDIIQQQRNAHKSLHA